jgi:hypothetical protein
LAVRIHPEGTASHSADYTFSEYTFDRTIPANATGTDVYVNVIDDTELEGTEYVVMWVISDGSFAVDYQAATVSIADNDLGPVVSVSALADPSASEVGNDPAKYRITRTGSLDFPLEVRFTLPTGSGRALLGSDYLLADGTGADVQDRVTIPAGSEWLR